MLSFTFMLAVLGPVDLNISTLNTSGRLAKKTGPVLKQTKDTLVRTHAKNAALRWLDKVFQGQYLPSLSINYDAINKDLKKIATTVVLDKDEDLLR